MNLIATTDALAPTPNATRRVSGISVGGSRSQMDFGALIQAYHALPMTAKAGWQKIADTLNAQQGRVGRHKLKAANAYCILASGNLAAGHPLPTNAPSSIAPPPRVPALTLNAAASGIAEDGTVSFSLVLASPLPYSCALQVLAAAPNPGKTTYPDTDFAPVTVIGSIPPGDTFDLADVYSQRYGAPELGAQVALKLIAINPAGVRLAPLLLCATVMPAASAAGSGDSELQQAA